MRAPLRVAVEKGHESTVCALLEAGVPVNQIDPVDGRSALHVVVMENHIVDAQEMLSVAGVDLTIRTDKGFTPVDLAVTMEHYELIELFLEFVRRNADSIPVGSVLGSSLGLASGIGNTEVVVRLLNADIDSDSQEGREGMTALIAAAEGGCPHTVLLLLCKEADKGLKARDDGREVLHSVLMSVRHGDFTRLLLDDKHGSGVINLDVKDINGVTPLLWAVSHGK